MGQDTDRTLISRTITVRPLGLRYFIVKYKYWHQKSHQSVYFEKLNYYYHQEKNKR